MTSRIAYKRKLKNLDLEDALEEIEGIRSENGGIIPAAAVVDRAEPADSVLHDCFEWNNTIAAAQHRLTQARELIRNFEIIFDDAEPAPAYVAVRIKSDDGSTRRGYKPTGEALESEELRTQVLKQAVRQMLALRKRFQRLGELAGVWEELEAVAERNDLQELMTR